MKMMHGLEIPDHETRLCEVEGKLIEQLRQMITMVEDRVGEDRLEAEYAYARNLISSRNTRLREKRRSEGRNALA